ncbi:DUF2726 domain-containing protein [Endozoicomonas sp. SM1973]|uniref:DUF2726 domain-containing protein n=1 Tax=Spartinivicinus marinus TaxID=2994442 RepID=A0A853IGX2_9GAMM|nr:DUF2726 domain-containing protein [Spartinivicinus marinus]MCX4028196.1 DUF2726 domain-containing protein [Spartinivicinus marinus]NYZ68395.1 DUF2726 domain-containing protein [Spartinivicinus marinus]
MLLDSWSFWIIIAIVIIWYFSKPNKRKEDKHSHAVTSSHLPNNQRQNENKSASNLDTTSVSEIEGRNTLSDKDDEKLQFYEEQLNQVNQYTYTSKPLLNHSEVKLYWVLVNFFKSKQLLVFAQVNLGQLLGHHDNDVHAIINSKRVDFCITNRRYLPVLVIEYNGKGHNQAYAQQRDQIKQKAVEGAGIIFEAIEPKDMNIINQKLDNIYQKIMASN